MSIGEYLKSIFSLEGKTILISGATGGIGSAISRGLAAAGAETALCARNQQKCRQTRSPRMAARRRRTLWIYPIWTAFTAA